jgi:5-hydroxyisourate hydrolase
MPTGGISIHCVDVSRGRVATGLRVVVSRLGGEVFASGQVNDKGVLAHPALMDAQVGAGGYEVRFEVGAFYRRIGVDVPSPAFLETVAYQFHIADASQHYHLPFKFTPWGYSLFRGGA